MDTEPPAAAPTVEPFLSLPDTGDHRVVIVGAGFAGLRLARRIAVDDRNRVPGLDGVYALGDLAEMRTDAFPKGHPMLAPVAQQQADRLADNLLRARDGKDTRPFRYRDKGSMATIGRHKAVVDFVGISRSGILHHDFPRRVAADPAFVPIANPVSPAYLASEGLGPAFVDYMRRWPGFVTGAG